MKSSLLTGTSSLAALILLAQHGTVQAQTTVTGERSTPIVTSNDGNVILKPEAELEVSAPVAITVNSNSNVTIETDEESDDEENLDRDDDVERARVTAGEVDGAVGQSRFANHF